MDVIFVRGNRARCSKFYLALFPVAKVSLSRETLICAHIENFFSLHSSRLNFQGKSESFFVQFNRTIGPIGDRKESLSKVVFS